MKRVACQYAIARFLPYVETGEFANVGIVLACPSVGYLGKRLMPVQRTGRVAAFFQPLDKRVYRDVMGNLDEELARIARLVDERFDKEGPALVQETFADVTRARESLLRFSATRAVLGEDPEATLDELFARFVERDFADKPYLDRLLERQVRDVLIRADVRKFYEPKDVGNDYVHVRFPFVHAQGTTVVAAIKPLDLSKDDSNHVFDLGGHWLEHVRRLRKHALLPQVLFAVRKPDADAIDASAAVDEIINEMAQEGVTVATANDTLAITRFARAALH